MQTRALPIFVPWFIYYFLSYKHVFRVFLTYYASWKWSFIDRRAKKVFYCPLLISFVKKKKNARTILVLQKIWCASRAKWAFLSHVVAVLGLKKPTLHPWYTIYYFVILGPKITIPVLALGGNVVLSARI